MNQGFRIVLVENGCQRKVATASSYDSAIKIKKQWKKSNPSAQLVIQPNNTWAYPNG